MWLRENGLWLKWEKHLGENKIIKVKLKIKLQVNGIDVIIVLNR